MSISFRALNPEEVEVRVGQVGRNFKIKEPVRTEGNAAVYAGYATFLLYKDARVDMTILDEVVGPERWSRDHKEIKGNLYGGIGIYFPETKNWVWKWDCGTESNTEKEKGEASDSFKRAGTNWGIGRELYTAPRIKLECPVVANENGKGYKLANPFEFYGMYVKELECDELDNKRVITKCVLNIKNFKDDTKVFEYDAYK